MQWIRAHYHLSCPAGEVEQAAAAIAVEQTVEVPDALIDTRIRADVVGRVTSIERVAAERFAVCIEYDAALACGQLPQLINLVYGNITMRDFIRLVDLDLPGELLARFRGPNFGVDGLRALLGVHGRPLLCTALKPRGSPIERFVEIAHEFALAGGDLVKDDHNLVDADLDAFSDRVERCRDAVEKANATTGRNCLYLPYLCAPADRMERSVQMLLQRGVRGVLVPPMILGLDSVRDLAARHGLLVMSHPTFTGTFFHDPRHGIEPGLLLGTLFRLAGVDATVFVNHGGRYSYSVEECASIARRVREPLGDLAPALPAPAGGMGLANVPEMADLYGADTVCLVGGALLSLEPRIGDSTRRYLDAIRAIFDERLSEPMHEPPAHPVR
jgi:ribulose-bisphosphate carboxylase large chain